MAACLSVFPAGWKEGELPAEQGPVQADGCVRLRARGGHSGPSPAAHLMGKLR